METTLKYNNHTADVQFPQMTKAKTGQGGPSSCRKATSKCISSGKTDMTALSSPSPTAPKSSRRSSNTYGILSNRQKYPKEVQPCANDYAECSKADYEQSAKSLRNMGDLEHFQKATDATVKTDTLRSRISSNGNFEKIPALPVRKLKSSHKYKNESNIANKINLIAFFNTLSAMAMHATKTRLHNRENSLLQTPTKTTKFRYHQPTTSYAKRTKFRFLPSLGATSLCTLITLVCLETLLLSTVTSCAKTFYMHWNTSNSIFRIDNTDHIIDVNKGNLAFEFDQVHIICPVYEPGTYENETEKYIIYNVSKVEYETCRITNADPRVIAICDKPQKLMFFTITFRPFTPQPGGLEFLPGNDYYFISTSSKDDLYRRIGGRCSTNNMKVVFKVCCAPEDKNKTGSSPNTNTIGGESYAGSSGENNNVIKSTPNINQQSPHLHNVNTIGISGTNNGIIPNGNVNNAGNSGGGSVLLKPISGQSGTSINTNIDQFNRIPIQTSGNGAMMGSGIGLGNTGGNGIMLTPGGHNGVNMIPTGSGIGIGQYPTHYPGHTGIRINNVATQHHPSQKNNNNDDHPYDKHPNEVVKNEELTYNSASSSLHQFCTLKYLSIFGTSLTYVKSAFSLVMPKVGELFRLVSSKCVCTATITDISNVPVLLSCVLLAIAHYVFQRTTTNCVTDLKAKNVADPPDTSNSKRSCLVVRGTAKCWHSKQKCSLR